MIYTDWHEVLKLSREDTTKPQIKRRTKWKKSNQESRQNESKRRTKWMRPVQNAKEMDEIKVTRKTKRMKSVEKGR
jgi:hypothetical protein